jgi:hypothetical protein
MQARISLALTALWTAAAFARADTVTLTAAQDTTIYESVAPFDYGSAELNKSNGAGDFIFAGRANSFNSGLIRRGLLAFDIAGAVPAGATITSVSLRLYLSQTITSPVLATAVGLHRVERAWGEGASDASGQEGGGANAQPGDATWLHTSFNSGTWTMPGGDFAAVASATTSVGDRNSFYSWSSPAMTADAQLWLEQPAANFGWLLLGDESVQGTAKRFDSRDSFNFDIVTGVRTIPVLTIEYISVPEPATSMLLLLGAAVAARRIFRRR